MRLWLMFANFHQAALRIIYRQLQVPYININQMKMEFGMKLTPKVISPNKRSHGQGMTEYIVIVALIAVAALAIYQLFGATLRNQTAAVAMEVAGKDGSTAITQAGTAAGKAETQAKDPTKGSLSTYGNQAKDGQQ
jgi:type IV pilus assembly protein PilA